MRFVLTFLMVLLSQLAVAQIPDRPNPPRLVNDLANVLSPSFKNQLEADLNTLSVQTGTQIVLLTVPDLQGYDKAEFAYTIGEKWGVGQKGKDNGIVVLFKPKTDTEKGAVFIATGYGLEGIIPDATANRIIDVEMIPRFRENDVEGGLLAGIAVLKQLSLQEFPASDYMQKTKPKKKKQGFSWFGILIVFAFLVLWLSRRGGSNFGSRGGLSPLDAILIGSALNRGGGWRDFSSGSGGFGGFGGGSFGGGGAGGDW